MFVKWSGVPNVANKLFQAGYLAAIVLVSSQILIPPPQKNVNVTYARPLQK